MYAEPLPYKQLPGPLVAVLQGLAFLYNTHGFSGGDMPPPLRLQANGCDPLSAGKPQVMSRLAFPCKA
jgi:hypothetical protein